MLDEFLTQCEAEIGRGVRFGIGLRVESGRGRRSRMGRVGLYGKCAPMSPVRSSSQPLERAVFIRTVTMLNL